MSSSGIGVLFFFFVFSSLVLAALGFFVSLLVGCMRVK